MIRRRFLGLMTLAGAGGLTTLKAAQAANRRTVVYRINGFTCITCAVGLETLLEREKGVLSARATYPAAIATVTFDANSIAERSIVMAIESMGFHAEPIQSS